MFPKRSIEDSPLHKKLEHEGMVLDRSKSAGKKVTLNFEWETENYFRYTCRLGKTKTTTVYIPKNIWGKRVIEIFVGTHEYVDTVRLAEERAVEILASLNCRCINFQPFRTRDFVSSNPPKKTRRPTARKRSTPRNKK
jgi:hypothetical protein